MSQYDLFTLGETMLRLSPAPNLYLEQAKQLDMNFAGAESNVASSVARLGLRTAWFSSLPNSPLGRACANQLRGHGVDTSVIHWSDEARMGTYYIEYGTPPRGIRVWYDRKNSAASQMTPDMLPLDVLRQSRRFHVTGITPALSDSCYATTQAALSFCQENGIMTSFDVNYRALLWDAPTAAAKLDPFCKQADMVFVALRDAVNLWGMPENIEEARTAAYERWGGCVIVTSGHQGAFASDSGQTSSVGSRPVDIVDRLGAGDAFAAGTLYGLLSDMPLQEAMNYGTGLAALALTTLGDLVYATREELEQVVMGNSGSLRR
ncbi:MAG: sugar kinase [Anaerolineae bacterium]|nr:sugar kinase [Anaerolineae bacterium]